MFVKYIIWRIVFTTNKFVDIIKIPIPELEKMPWGSLKI